MMPRYASFVIPARWFDGGRGLDSFRKEMLGDKRISKLVDFGDSSECFPGVDIAGGVCYFLWDRGYDGECEVKTVFKGEIEVAKRFLGEYPTFVRSKKALDIIKKVEAFGEPTMDSIVSSQKPYGLRTYERPRDSGDLILRWSGGEGPLPAECVTAGKDWVNRWKVFTSYLTHDHAGKTDAEGRRRIISILEVASPGKVCTETYLSIGSFDTEAEARNLDLYIRSKFVRFLILQMTSTQHLSKASFFFVPCQSFDERWDDEKLYAKYGISQEEINYIESKVSPMGLDDVPATIGGSDAR